jgi:ubiquinone/menaquinone biosynthesis C-methylase UbiE
MICQDLRIPDHTFPSVDSLTFDCSKAKQSKRRKTKMELAQESLQQTVSPLEGIKKKQQTGWASGDYGVIGITLQIVGESLCEAVDLQAGERVLDVAAGNGNATLAAARRWADVTSLDYVPALLERTKERAKAERLSIHISEADAENIPFPDQSFDVVLSTFGVMFSPNQERAAGELLRVCRKGGRIGLANWTPEGFVGKLFRIVGKFVPPLPGIKPPALWGTRERLTELFGSDADIEANPRQFVFRYESAEHFIRIFHDYYGPIVKAYEVLDGEKQQELSTNIRDLLLSCNTSKTKLAVPSEYLEIVIRKK